MTPAKRVILFGLALGTSVTVAALVLRGQASQALTMAWFAFLKKLDPMEKYVYVITLAVHFRERFEQPGPNGRFVRFSDNYSLFAN